MNEDLIVRQNLIIPAAELAWSTSRASGPGGQHVNKTSSRVSVRWDVLESAILTESQRKRILEKLSSRLTGEGVLVVNVESSRSQHRNRQLASERLVELVRQALVRPKKRVPTRPSKAAKKRRIEAKKRRSGIKSNRKKPRLD